MPTFDNTHGVNFTSRSFNPWYGIWSNNSGYSLNVGTTKTTTSTARPLPGMPRAVGAYSIRTVNHTNQGAFSWQQKDNVDKNKVYTSQCEGALLQYGWWSVPTRSAETQNRAFERFWKKASAYSMDLPTFIGEGRESAMMLEHRGRQLAGSLDDFVKGADRIWKRAIFNQGGTIKDIVDLYLEYVFGWKPLFSDINAAVEALMSRKKFDSIGAFDRETVADVRSKSLLVSGMGVNYGCLPHLISTVYTTQVSCFASLIDDFLANNSENWNLQYGAMLTTGWELIPYSFLADYVTNVGSVIEACATPSLPIYQGCYGVKDEKIVTCYVNKAEPGGCGGNPYAFNLSGYASGEHSETSFNRIPSVPPYPYPRVKRFDEVTAGQLVNTAALLVSKLPLGKDWLYALDRPYGTQR